MTTPREDDQLLRNRISDDARCSHDFRLAKAEMQRKLNRKILRSASNSNEATTNTFADIFSMIDTSSVDPHIITPLLPPACHSSPHLFPISQLPYGGSATSKGGEPPILINWMDPRIVGARRWRVLLSGTDSLHDNNSSNRRSK